MGERKYESQIKNLRKNYVRFPLDLKPEVLEAFKSACAANGTTPTTEIKKFITRYTAYQSAKSAPVPSQVALTPEQVAQVEALGIDINKILIDALTELCNDTMVNVLAEVLAETEARHDPHPSSHQAQ